MSTDHSTSRVVLVIPCYNEAQRLDRHAFAVGLVERPWLSLLFVDDGSTDTTADVLAEFCRTEPTRTRFMSLARNSGKAEAVRQGLTEAVIARPDLVGFWDADLATPLRALDEFVAVLDASPRVRWVIGARVKLLGRDIQRRSMRHYLGRVFATAASLVLQLPVYDTQCGAKLFRADSVLEHVIAKPFRSRWIFDVEMLSRLGLALQAEEANASHEVYELPLHEWIDVAGSKVRGRDFLRASLELFGIWRERTLAAKQTVGSIDRRVVAERA